MEPWLIVLLGVLAILVLGGIGFVATKGRAGRNVGVPVEPPASAPQRTIEPRVAPPDVPVAPRVDVAVLDRPASTEDREDLAEQVPEAEPSIETVIEPVIEPSIEPEVEAELVKPKFRDRLGKARGALGGYFGGVLGRSTIDQTTWDDLEEALIVADVGPGTTTEVLDDLKLRVKSEAIKTPEVLMEALRSDLKKRLAPGDRTLRFDPGVTNVWLFVGVNGVGKTTTIGKLAKRETANGRTVLMAAGDTFRAAAAEQLGMWADRVGCEIVRGAEGADPASVIYTGVEKAAAKGVELVLADTAGRLQTKTNLMEELGKIRRVADKEPGRVTETFLVLDATTGQNGLTQAEQFRGAADITGVVLTKLDGTAKGGIAFAIQTKLGIPIKLVGLGEQVQDLVPFDPEEYVDALFAE
jgi:fused signal recognition particle receptor